MSRTAAVAPLLVLALALGACSGDDAAEPDPTAVTTTRLIQGAAPGEENQTLTQMPEFAEPEATEADVIFVQMMLVHHAQALDMTALVPDRTSRQDVPLFAERIELTQAGEIELMEGWLADRDLPTVADEGHDHHSHGDAGRLMPGLLTDEELAELAAADGTEFDRLFLEYMHYHHAGAVTMVEELLAEGGGQEPELAQLVNHIDSDQRIEMDRITSMLAELDAS